MKNNLYALKLLFKLSPGIVYCRGFRRIIGYAEWLFYSAFFMRYIVYAYENNESFGKIALFLGIVAAVFAFVTVYKNFDDGYATPVCTTIVNKKLNSILFKKALNVDLRCFENSDFYNKYTLAMQDADTRLIETVDVFWGMIFGFVATIAAFSFVFSIDKWAVLFVIFPILGNFIFNVQLGKIEFKRNEDMAYHNRKIAYVNRVMYMTEYAKEMRLTSALSLMQKRYREALSGIGEVVSKYHLKGAIMHWLRCSFTFSFIFEGVMLYGAYRSIVSKTLSLSEYAVIIELMVSTSWILIGFCDSCMTGYKNGLFIQNLKNFMEHEPEIPEDYDGIPADEGIKTLEFRNVSFSYGEGNVLENISFTLEGSKTYALVGYNGAGKSTLIKLLMRFYDPTEGKILLNGRNIKEYNLASYRRLWATAFQDHMIFSATVKENVLMRDCKESSLDDDERVISALKMAGVYDKVSSLPKGIETMLTKEFDEDGALLSGGEFQKIVVARAFATDSCGCIFDEPSSALDPIAECNLFDNILENGENKTMLFVSHRLSSVKNADCVFLLADKNLAECGSHDELMKLNGLYAEMYNKQAVNYLAVSENDWKTISEAKGKTGRIKTPAGESTQGGAC